MDSSTITQETVTRPFTIFFEEAKCEKYHPDHISIQPGFGR